MLNASDPPDHITPTISSTFKMTDNFKFVTLDKDSVLMTYTAMQEGVCSGKTIPANVRASVVYVKRGGKWLEVYGNADS
jgi:hypothetical protein